MTDSPLRCLLKPHPDGGYVLLSVNLDDAVLSATYRFPTALAQVQAMFENQPALAIERDRLSFVARYEPFDTHVHRIVPGLAIRMPQCTAAICLAQLEEIEDRVRHIDAMARLLMGQLAEVRGITPPTILKYQEIYSAWWR